LWGACAESRVRSRLYGETSVPKFFFQLENTDHVHDVEGTELEDVEAAKCHAVSLIAESLCAHPKGFWDAETYQITVTDEWGLTLFMICMMSVVAPVLQQQPR
jgi:hypothetical protein